MQNGLVELFSIFDLIQPDCFGDRSEFDQRFAAPIKKSKQRGASAEIMKQGAAASIALRKIMDG